MVQTRWKAESRAIKRRKESKDKKPYDRNIDSRSSAVMRNDIFRVDNKETVRQYIITLDTVTNIQHRRIILGSGQAKIQLSQVYGVLLLFWRGSRLHPVSSQTSARNKQSVDANDNHLRPVDRQENQVDKMNSYKKIWWASLENFYNVKLNSRKNIFLKVNVKGRLSKHVDFWKNVLMPVIQIQMLFFFRIHSVIFSISNNFNMILEREGYLHCFISWWWVLFCR